MSCDRSRQRCRESYDEERHSLAFSPQAKKKRVHSLVESCGVDSSVRPLATSDTYCQTAWDDRQKLSSQPSPRRRGATGPHVELTTQCSHEATIGSLLQMRACLMNNLNNPYFVDGRQSRCDGMYRWRRAGGSGLFSVPGATQNSHRLPRSGCRFD